MSKQAAVRRVILDVDERTHAAVIEALGRAASSTQRAAARAAAELEADDKAKDPRSAAVKITRVMADASRLSTFADQLDAAYKLGTAPALALAADGGRAELLERDVAAGTPAPDVDSGAAQPLTDTVDHYLDALAGGRHVEPADLPGREVPDTPAPAPAVNLGPTTAEDALAAAAALDELEPTADELAADAADVPIPGEADR